MYLFIYFILVSILSSRPPPNPLARRGKLCTTDHSQLKKQPLKPLMPIIKTSKPHQSVLPPCEGVRGWSANFLISFLFSYFSLNRLH